MGKVSKEAKKQRKQAQRGAKQLAKSLKKAIKSRSAQAPALPKLKKRDTDELVAKLMTEWQAKAKAEVIALFPEPTSVTPPYQGIDATEPYKKTPCKSCPALSGAGLCKCAVKRQRKSA